MISNYTKKPVTVKAVQWNGTNKQEIYDFVGESGIISTNDDKNELIIFTLEGNHHASIGDYIIEGVNGEFYSCKPDIFKKTYIESSDSIKDPTIENNFSFHNISEDKVNYCNTIRSLAKHFASFINQVVPDSREKSLSITKLEEATMWANAGISRYDAVNKSKED